MSSNGNAATDSPRWAGVHHLALVTDDMDATVRFYHGVLGADLVATIGNTAFRHYFFRFGDGQTIAFFEYSGQPVEHFAKPAGIPDMRASQFDHLSLGLSDESALGELRERLAAHGCEVTEVVDHDIMRSIYFTDPNGIALEASWWTLDATALTPDHANERLFGDTNPVPAVAEIAGGGLQSTPVTRLVNEPTPAAGWLVSEAQMKLDDALRSTGAVRDFTDVAVDDEVVWRILDRARFAPNGGNAQSWKVALIKDPAIRARVGELYVKGFHEYAAMGAAGLRPWAPVTDRDEEARAIAVGAANAAAGGSAGAFADTYHEVPVMLAVAADLRLLAAVDRDLERHPIVGGASVYPFSWSVLLAAHEEGLGGVMTTMPIRREPELAEVVGLPEHFGLACFIVLGHPVERAKRLRRKPVEAFTSVNRFDGEPFTGN